MKFLSQLAGQYRSVTLVVLAFASIGAVLLIAVSAATGFTAVDSDSFTLEPDTLAIKQDETAFANNYIEFAGEDDPDPGIVSVCDGVEAGAAQNIAGLSFQVAHTFNLDAQASGFNLLEGPVWNKDAFYFTRIDTSDFRSSIYKYAPGSVPELISDKGVRANGLATVDDTTLGLADFGAGAVSTFNIETNETQAVATEHQGKRLNSPNDIVHTKHGYYVTDPLWAPAVYPNVQGGVRVYFVNNDGEVSSIQTQAGFPNGIMVNAAEDRLFVIGQDGVYAHTLDENGIAGGPSKISGSVGMLDGGAIDCLGNMYIATNTPQVMILNSSGQQVRVITVPGADVTTNLTFGGADGKTLLLTDASNGPTKLFTAAMDVPGLSN